MFASISFICFVASWIVLRLTYFPFWILRSTRWECVPSCRLFLIDPLLKISVYWLHLLAQIPTQPCHSISCNLVPNLHGLLHHVSFYSYRKKNLRKDFEEWKFSAFVFSIIWWFLLSLDNWFTPYMSSKQWLRKTLPQVYLTKRWFVLNENPVPIRLSVVSPLRWRPWMGALWDPPLIPSPPVYPHLTHTHSLSQVNCYQTLSDSYLDCADIGFEIQKLSVEFRAPGLFISDPFNLSTGGFLSKHSPTIAPSSHPIGPTTFSPKKLFFGQYLLVSLCVVHTSKYWIHIMKLMQPFKGIYLYRYIVVICQWS